MPIQEIIRQRIELFQKLAADERGQALLDLLDGVDPNTEFILLSCVTDRSPDIRIRAVSGLADLGSSFAVIAARALLDDANLMVRVTVASGLPKWVYVYITTP